jgi:integrase
MAIYPVEDYLAMLRLAKRSEVTITGYRKHLKAFAEFLDVPVGDLHTHLSVANLLKYAATLTKRSDEGRKTTLSVLHRYFSLNGVEFDQLQYNAMKPKVTKEHNDKPLELETLQKMMDLTDTHGRAFLSFLISTGCRADEACNVLLSDIHGDCINIRNEIAKNGHGGRVYLTAEAREYLDLWLRERDKYINLADRRSVGLEKIGAIRPKHDKRLFGMSYASAHKMFSRLYDAVDGSRGKYHRECTIHSCRKYFRTHAAQAMHPDLVTGIMRQTGYLDSTYVRMTDEDRRKQFHKDEAVLYITRADHRIQVSALAALKKENQELRDSLQKIARKQQAMDIVDTEQGKLTPADHAAIAKLLAEEMKKDQVKS